MSWRLPGRPESGCCAARPPERDLVDGDREENLEHLNGYARQHGSSGRYAGRSDTGISALMVLSILAGESRLC